MIRELTCLLCADQMHAPSAEQARERINFLRNLDDLFFPFYRMLGL
jgi:hypothetical protein